MPLAGVAAAGEICPREEMREQISPARQPGVCGAWLSGVKGPAYGPTDQNPCLVEDQAQGGT